MGLINFDPSKSLAELEKSGKSNSRWQTSVVFRAHKLRSKPLKDFLNDELQLQITQNTALKYLVPLAIERLQKDPLIKGGSYFGELLNAVLTIEKKFWTDDLNDYIPVLDSIVEKARILASTNLVDYNKFIETSDNAVAIFKANTSHI